VLHRSHGRGLANAKQRLQPYLESKSREAESNFVEPGRTELAAALRQHIETLVVERATDPEPAGLNSRLKQLAVVLAEFDGQASSELILEILSYHRLSVQGRGRITHLHNQSICTMLGLASTDSKLC